MCASPEMSYNNKYLSDACAKATECLKYSAVLHIGEYSEALTIYLALKSLFSKLNEPNYTPPTIYIS